MNVRYRVELETGERRQLEKLVAGGSRAVRKIKRAQILLAAAAGSTDEEIARTVQVGTSTVYCTKRRFVEESLEQALAEDPRPGGRRKLAAAEEVMLVALACSTPPAGRATWTLALLAGAMVRLTPHAQISRHTIGRRLAENDLKPWQRKMWCVPRMDAEYVARMEDVLELYTPPPAPGTAVVCVDETPRQLIGRGAGDAPGGPRPARSERLRIPPQWHRERVCRGRCHRPWRQAKVTARRTVLDFPEWLREIADVHYPTCDRIQVVLDNLSPHTPAALYEAFAPEEARRLLRRLEFHYVPKHASWLNMVENEIGILASQCLDRRIPDLATLTAEVEAWVCARNAQGAAVQWMFGIEQARAKLGRAYPTLATAAVAAA